MLPSDVPSERVREQLERLLASRLLDARTRPGQFLNYIVEEALAGRGDALKETGLAMQIFHRKASFDPRIDSIVRVEAHHLRKRLREYYSTEGAKDDVVIEVPVGSYVPVFRLASVSTAAPPKRRMWMAAAGAVALLAALTAGVRWARTSAPGKSVAVLAFHNLSESDDDALCLGLSEDLTTQLARQPQLRVTSRSSAAQAQAQSRDVRTIGAALGVSTVVEGSVWREGKRIRITAQLVDTASGYQRWSESYERDAGDPLAVEAEVADAIVAGVARSLGVQVQPGVARTFVPAPESRRLYWESRLLRRAGTVDARAKAAEILEQVVAKDAGYVDAWAALANVNLTRTFHQEGDFRELARRTREAAEKAVSLDAGNTDGLVARAELEWLDHRNWPAAEEGLRYALTLNPSSPSARAWLATGLVTRGRFDDALQELDRASAISPISYVVSNDIATALYCARRWDAAIRQARRTLQVNPKFMYARIVIGLCHAAQGQYVDAIAELEQVAQQGGRGAVLGRLGYVLARAGRANEARAIQKELAALVAAGDRAGVHLAYVQTGLGDFNAALDSLEAAFGRHETDLHYIAVDAVFDALRGQKRFEELKRKLGLPE
ncbi:MAG: tetratricopeptide repeat protein [Bryobacterales bacterium]|nr:tetratricopeptide repeat protein [Bryobacterales bacterium]